MEIPSNYEKIGRTSLAPGKRVYVEGSDILALGTVEVNTNYTRSDDPVYRIRTYSGATTPVSDDFTFYAEKPECFADLPDGQYVAWTGDDNSLHRVSVINGTTGDRGFDAKVYAMYKRTEF